MHPSNTCFIIDPSEDRPAVRLPWKLYAYASGVSPRWQNYYTEIMETLATIHYGQAPTPFGPGLVGWSEQGVLMLHLLQAGDPAAQEILTQRYPESPLERSDSQARTLLELAFTQELSDPQPDKLKLALHGSPFQLKVWQGLLEIPFGEVRTYGALAESLGHPGAARAVGTAIAANQLAYVIPCHRVVRASGDSGQYRWGAERKAQMLAWERRQLADSNAAR
jgi:AraC family transcriptional regulator of adaptative response/methylated-DNA-[protein]-cysteine methyltransferase